MIRTVAGAACRIALKTAPWIALIAMTELWRRRGLPPPLDPFLPDDPRARHLPVAPHSLAPYDALAGTADETPEKTK